MTYKKRRYTVNRLREDLVVLNQKMVNIGSPYQFVIEEFNNMTWLAIATPDQMERHCTQDRLLGGTPKECYHRAVVYISFNV